MTVVGYLLEISRREDAVDIEWRIPRSDTEHLGRGVRCLSSPDLSFGGWEWWMLLVNEDPSSDSSRLLLRLCRLGPQSLSPSPLVRYWLGVVKVDGGREEEEIARGRMERPYLSHPWLPLPELRRRMGSSSPSSGDLSIVARLRTGPETDNEMRGREERERPASSRVATAEKSTQADFEDPETGGATSSAARGMETTRRDSEDALILREHLKKLLLHANDHDVTLKVKEKQFKAHKSMLRARSPVFEAMFTHQMKENEEDSVTIDDVDPDCFGAFLTYVYTGEVEDLSTANAMGLFYAAHKYDFPALKRRCGEVLKASLLTTLLHHFGCYSRGRGAARERDGLRRGTFSADHGNRGMAAVCPQKPHSSE